MSIFVDTSVVVASLDPDEPQHAACDRLMAAGGHSLYVHALAETFSILTGGRLGRRVNAAAATRLLEQSVLPFVVVQSLSGKDLMTALTECEARGVRGAAVYDLLHLAAARKAKAEVLLALDARNFRALARPGDPRIEHP